MAGRIESAPAAERYFCTLSPLCKRIISNVQTIRTLHADEWQDLSYEDRCQVIDGHMVNQETADHWRRLSRQPGDGAPSGRITPPAQPKMVEDEDPETGQLVRWRDEHAAPFSWRTPSQERMAAAGLAAEQAGRQAAVTQQPFVVRDSIRHRMSRVEHMYESFSPKRTVGDTFDAPSLVLGGSSGEAPAGSRSLKQQVLSRLARGRRVLLSITKLGKQPAVQPPRRPEISAPCPEISSPLAAVSPRLEFAAAHVERRLERPDSRGRESAAARVEAAASRVEPAADSDEAPSPGSSRRDASPSPTRPEVAPRPAAAGSSFRRGAAKPTAPPPPPPVQAALVPIRTSAAHAPSVRSSSQYAAPAVTPPPSPPPPVAGAPRAQPTPPQLKRVPPPVVPRRDSATPEREPPRERTPERRAEADGSERQPEVVDEQPRPLFQQREEETAYGGKYASYEPEPDPEPYKAKFEAYEPEPEPYKAKYEMYEPERRQEEEQPESFQSVLEQPTQVEIKTGFDFLDNW